HRRRGTARVLGRLCRPCDRAGAGGARCRATPETDRMTVRGTLGLLAAAAALVAVVGLDRTPILPQRPLPTPDTPPLLDAPVGAVSRVEWERDGERLSLVRTPDGWHDAAGHPWPADVVDVALDALASLHPHTVVADESVELAQFGLAPAAERLPVLGGTGAGV